VRTSPGRFVRKATDRASVQLFGYRPGSYGAGVVSGEPSQELIRACLTDPAPRLVSRLGANEQGVLLRAEFARHLPMKETTRGRLIGARHLLEDLETQAGFFTEQPTDLCRFDDLYRSSLEDVDVLGAWYRLFEAYVVKRNVIRPQLVSLGSLDPFRFRDPWSAALAGRRVCVVHPFAESIERQYARRSELFVDERVLPEFELSVVRAHQHSGGAEHESSWFESLHEMEQQISACRPEIVLVGAGAFGLPLGAYAKRQGMHAVHMGGSLQLLFGILGGRWENDPGVVRVVNDTWVRPLESERPVQAERVEGGCYW